MKIGRNTSCPCGSGKKYKHCCLKLDAERRRYGGDAGRPGDSNEAAIRRAARRAKTWQVDLLAFAARFGDDPGARPANLMVTAAGFVIFHDVLGRPSAEVEDIAAELHRGIFEAGARVGGFPRRIEVREAEVATALERLIREGGSPIPVRAAPLPEMDKVRDALHESMGGQATPFSVSRPELWAGWGHPDDWIAEMFTAGAAYFRAGPWRHFDNFPPIVAVSPAERVWYLSIMGSGGVEYGLNFYSDPYDPDRILDHDPGGPEGRVLSLTFDREGKLPRPMQREISRAGWQVASPDAYPILLAINTPAGGLRRVDADDLVTITAAVAAWAAVIDGDPELADAGPWRDPETGVELEVQGFRVVEASDLA